MADEIETWRPVVGLEGCYEVSDLGRIRSLDRVVNNGWGGRHVPSQIIRTQVNWKAGGYEYVAFSREDRVVRRKVHRAVAEAFIGPCDKEVNHIDGNKLNNRVSNLEYVTSSQNKQHARATGLWANRGAEHGNSVFGDDDARRAYARYAAGEKLIDIATSMGVTKQAIGNIVSGARWAHLGLAPIRKYRRRATCA